MIGAEYAQFSSYIPSDKPVFDHDKKFLPPYLLPTFQIPHPWPHSKFKSAGFEDDFIMVAEFSEIEGPKPVMVIPKHGGHNFDQNTFAVKIMAVDHQATSVGFSISEDTQVVISEDKDGIYSFVHHFVLYDNQARGFVRPFCMAYVTTEKRKIMTFYEELCTQFRKVARFLKYGNRMVFVRDLDRYLSDLEFTKGQLRTKQTSSESEDTSDTNVEEKAEEEAYRDLQNIRASMHEVQDILSTLKPLLNDRRVESRFQVLEDRAWQQKLRTDCTQTDAISLEENWFAKSRTNTLFKCGSVSDASDSTLSMFQRNTTYTPKLVSADKRKKFDSALRGLHELCSWGAKEGLKKLRCIQEHYKRETMILELERSESNLLDPPGSLMMCGRCLTANFLTGVSMRGLDLSSRLADTPLSTPGSEIMKRWPSSDTLDSFKSVGSFMSLGDEADILSLGSADASSPPMQSLPPSPVTGLSKTMLTNLGSSYDSDTASSLYQTDEAPSVSESLCQLVQHDPERQLHPQSHDGNDTETTRESRVPLVNSYSNVNVSSNDSTVQKKPCLSRQLSGDTSCSEISISPSQYVQFIDKQGELECMASIEQAVRIRDQPNIMGSSQEENSGETVPSTSSGDETSPSANSSSTNRKPKSGLYSLGDLVDKLEPGIPGFGITSVLSTYINLQHVVYSLLIGRTVLVVGSPRMESEVTKIVTALAVFLPDHRRKHPATIEWLSKCLKLADLSRIKLAGVCRPEKRGLDCVVPNVVKKYSTVIDMDRQFILAPKYQGNLVTAILNKRKVFNTDSQLVAYIHCWLMEITSKAFIFYHSFCLGNAGSIMYDYSLQKQKEHYQSTVKSFIAKLGVGDFDTQIIEYMAEVVKMSEIEPYVRQTQLGGVARPIFLNYLPCQKHPLRI